MVLLIAECGVNHLGNLSLAYDLIDQAKRIGANIAKFQLYSVDALFPDKQIVAQGRNWYEEIKRTELTKSQVFKLAEHCQKVGIEFMASSFDLERLSWLEECGVVRHKLASRCVNDVPLIQAVRFTGKEVLASVPYGDFAGAIELLKNASGRFRYLYCVPEYPTPLSHLKFESVPWGSFSGFSDHTVGITASKAAIAKGMRIIERHFCLKRNLSAGPDFVCSSTPGEFARLVKFAREYEEMSGS